MQGALASTAAWFRRSFERGAGNALAGASHGIHGYIDWLARQIDPRTADEDVLERVHGEPFGVFRKDAVAAKLTATAPGANGVLVAAGTAWTRSDGARYTVDASVTVTGGTATVALTADVAGAAQNCDNGTALDIESPIAGLNGTATIASTTRAGTDRETPSDYLARILERRQSPTRGGARGDYVDWVLEVAGVTRAWEFPRRAGAGTVTVFAVNDADDPITLGSPKLTEIATYLDQPGRQPTTVDVFVLTPSLFEVDTNIELTPDTPEVRAAVLAELAALYRRIGTPEGQTIPLSQIDEAISIAAGEVSHVRNLPNADVVTAFGELPVVGAAVWS